MLVWIQSLSSILVAIQSLTYYLHIDRQRDGFIPFPKVKSRQPYPGSELRWPSPFCPTIFVMPLVSFCLYASISLFSCQCQFVHIYFWIIDFSYPSIHTHTHTHIYIYIYIYIYCGVVRFCIEKDLCLK